MNLMKVKNPIYSIQDFREEMDRMIQDAFGDFGLVEQRTIKEGMVWKPAVELNEVDGTYQLKAELPGINKDDIDIQVGEEEIALKAKTEKYEQKEEKGKIHRSEFRYGEFARIIPLPSMVDSEDAKAEFKDGILTVTVHKSKKEEEKIKKLKIEN